jgi:peroxidase
LALTGVHVLFLREHNRLANALRVRHSNWNDEQLYQEAKRINTAQIQNIVYREWLPAVIGSRADNLLPLRDGYFGGYDPRIDPSLANEFGVAAFRFGHTLVRNSLDRFNLFHINVNSPVNLSSIIFDVTEATK